MDFRFAVTDDARQMALESAWSMALVSEDGSALHHQADLPQQAWAMAVSPAADCEGCDGDVINVVDNTAGALVSMEIGADALHEVSRADLDVVIGSLARAPEGWIAGFGTVGGMLWTWSGSELTFAQAFDRPASEGKPGDLVVGDLDSDGRSDLIAGSGSTALVYRGDPSGDRTIEVEPAVWDIARWFPKAEDETERIASLATVRFEGDESDTLLVALTGSTGGRICALRGQVRGIAIEPDRTSCADLPFDEPSGDTLVLATGDVWPNAGDAAPEVIVGCPAAGGGRGAVAVFPMDRGGLAPHPVVIHGTRPDGAFGASLIAGAGTVTIGEPGIGLDDGQILTFTAACP